MSNDYFALYQHPLWQKKRLEKLDSANYECTNCGNKDNQLHVHHKQYFKGRNPWEYDNEQLDVLCDICHKNIHHVIDAIKMMISYSDTSEIYNILSGYLDEKIRIKSYEFENVMSFYEQSKQNIGLIAGLLNYVHPKYQSNIADFIISLSFNEEEATDFFRKKFESAEDYDE